MEQEQQQQRRSLDHETLLCVCHFGVFTCCFWFVYGLVTWPHMLTDALSGLSDAGRDALRFATVGGTQWEPDRRKISELSVFVRILGESKEKMVIEKNSSVLIFSSSRSVLTDNQLICFTN